MSKRALILGTVRDLVGSLLYYDRKADEELGVGDIPSAIRCGEVSSDDMVDAFRSELVARLPKANNGR
jgi:hypothetical protein